MSVGQIIVSKVFVGHSMPIRVGEEVDRSRYPKAYSVYRNVDTKLRTAMFEGMRYLKRHENNYFSQYLFNVIASLCVFHSEKPLSSKTHSGPECSPRRRQWFVFDHELVLPEYIIYFEYIAGVMNPSVLLLYIPMVLQVNMLHELNNTF